MTDAAELPVNVSRYSELGRLWTKHQFTVAAFIGARSNDFTQAEELMQETAVQIFENAERFDMSRPFLPWCLGIARNVVLKHRRNRARDRHRFNYEAMENLALAFQEIAEEQDDLRRSLAACRKKLSRRAQEICQLRYEQDLQPREIADRIGGSPVAMASALYRIREQLRVCIKQHLGLEDSL